MESNSLNDILADFSVMTSEDEKRLKERKPVTIWLSAEAKARYDRLQEKSGRKFGKKAREALLMLIDSAEARVSA